MHGEPIVYEACRKFARMLIPLAHVTDEVLLTPGGRCLRLTTVFDEADADVAAGRLKGWYVASWIERSVRSGCGRAGPCWRNSRPWTPDQISLREPPFATPASAGSMRRATSPRGCRSMSINRPPWASAMARAIERPSPNPLPSRVRAGSLR